MVNPDDLLNSLVDNSRAYERIIHPREVTNRLGDLRNWADRNPHFEHNEKRSIICAGDPMLIDGQGNMHHYWGSAVMVVFNQFGVVTALEYVSCTPDRNYIREVWRHEVATDKYKYKYLGEAPNVKVACTGRVRVDDPQFTVGDESWHSEKYPDEVPSREFFNNFTSANRTFFINSTTGSFMQGPDFGVIQQVLKAPVTVVKPLIGHMGEKPQEWMVKAAQMITERSCYHYSDHSRYHKKDNPKTTGDIVKKIKKVQVAQFACGLTVSVMSKTSDEQLVEGH